MIGAWLGEVEVGGDVLDIVEEQYRDGRVAVVLYDQEGERYCTVSINVPNAPLSAGDFVVDRDVDVSLYLALIRTSLFVDTGRRVDYGSRSGMPVWGIAGRGDGGAGRWN